MAERAAALSDTQDADATVSDVLVSALVELSTADGVRNLSQLLCEFACAVTGVDGASIEVVDGLDLEFRAATGMLAGSEGTRVPRDGSLSGLAISTARSQLCADARVDSRVAQAACAALGIRSMAVIPIRHSHHTVAVLTLAGLTPDSITPQHVELVAPLVQAGSARLIQAEAAELAAARWEMLNNIANASKEVLLAEDPAQRLVEATARVINAPQTLLMLPDADNGLTAAAAYGFDLAGYRVGQDERSLTGTAFVTGRTQIVADWVNHPKVPDHAIAIMSNAGIVHSRAGIFVPLQTPDGPVGVLAAFLPALLTAADAALLGLLQLLAAEAGLALSRADMRARLAEQARTDPLTGAANRRVWTERFEHEVALAERTKLPLLLAMLDLDYFKNYNDAYGHVAGDELLVSAVTAWGAALRPTDLLARLGGEEFGILLPAADLDEGLAIMERLRTYAPFGQTVSIGLTAHRSGEGLDATTLRADEALYAAKRAGRDRIITR